MNDFTNDIAKRTHAAKAPGFVEITIEELVVYRFVVPADADDPEGVALDRFRSGELPDRGPSEGEQHDLSTYFVGDAEPLPPQGYDDWLATYHPVRNPYRADAPSDGLMFETFGPECEAVRAANPACVWTLVAGDDDALVILSGIHFVDRLGYFITEFLWPREDVVEIPLD
ncbi:MAG: hypothetical protein AB7P12_13035 [Alphaproteobacteria bacterium]